MILIDNDFFTTHAAAVYKARNEKLRCVKLERDLYYSARRKKGHGQYVVRIKHEKDQWYATCRSVEGMLCPASKGRRCCVHIAVAILRANNYAATVTRRQRTRKA